MRPADVDVLLADPTKANQKLKWEREVKFADLVTMMVDAALARIQQAKDGAVPKLPVS